MNTLIIQESAGRKAGVLLLLAFIVSFIVVQGGPLLAVILAGTALFVILIKKPELSLAILFNGTLIYFYFLYKLDVDSSTLLSGGFYAFLAISYLTGGGLLNSKNLHNLKLSSFDILFILFLFWVFLSFFIFHSGSESAYKKTVYAPLLVITPYLGVRLLSTKERIEKFFTYCVVLSSILIVPSLYELLFNLALATTAGFSIYLIRGEEANHILFGLTFAISLLIMFTKFFEHKTNKYQSFFLIIPSIYLLLRSGSRGALISFFITIALYILFIRKVRLRSKLTALFFIVILIISSYKLMPEVTVASYRSTFEYQDIPVELSSVQQRFNMWSETINDFKEHPIFGVGIGNSAHGSGFPHNIILEVSAELGAIGLFIFLSLCYLSVKKSIRFIKTEKRQDINLLMKLSFLLFTFSFIEAMFSGYITNQTQLFMSMGLIVTLTRYKQDTISSSNKQFKS